MRALEMVVADMRELDADMRRLERTRATFDVELECMKGRLRAVSAEMAVLHRRIAELQSTASWSRYRRTAAHGTDR